MLQAAALHYSRYLWPSDASRGSEKKGEDLIQGSLEPMRIRRREKLDSEQKWLTKEELYWLSSCLCMPLLDGKVGENWFFAFVRFVSFHCQNQFLPPSISFWDSQIIRAKCRVPIFTLAGWKIANFNGFNFHPEQSFILASLSSSNEV